MAKMVKERPVEISILELSQGEVTFNVVGTSPIIYNKMSEKAKRTLLLPGGRMSKADKETSLKHDPVTEYRDSVYRNSGDDAPTRLKVPAPAFKGASMTAALYIPGSSKTEIGRLTWVTDEYINLFGIPKLLMSVVRMADISKTPDIRTRAIVTKWASRFTMRFVQPQLSARGVANLVAASGIISGIGDFRQEKGKGSFGQFRLCDADDPEFLEIIKTGGRVAQDQALDHYTCYDSDTEELLDWYNEEILRRGRKPPASGKPGRGKLAAVA